MFIWHLRLHFYGLATSIYCDRKTGGANVRMNEWLKECVSFTPCCTTAEEIIIIIIIFSWIIMWKTYTFFSFLQKLQRNRRFVTLWRITEFFYDVAKLQHLSAIMARQPTSQTNTCICIKNTRQFFCIDNFMFSTCSISKIVWEIFFWKNVFGKK